MISTWKLKSKPISENKQFRPKSAYSLGNGLCSHIHLHMLWFPPYPLIIHYLHPAIIDDNCPSINNLTTSVNRSIMIDPNPTSAYLLIMTPPVANASANIWPQQTKHEASKQARESLPTPTDFYTIGKEVQKCHGESSGSDSSEDRRFHAFFGCSTEAAGMLWTMLVQCLLPPMKGRFTICSGHSSSWSATQLKSWHA